MNMFLWNLFLAFIWTTMSGLLSLANLLVGFIVGYFILLLVQRILG
jgi:multisubunit Na+/H+ antiporter MnhE subunit